MEDIVHCPTCGGRFDFKSGYGKMKECCCKACYAELFAIRVKNGLIDALKKGIEQDEFSSSLPSNSDDQS